MPKDIKMIALRAKTDRQLLTLAGHKLDDAAELAAADPIRAQDLFCEARKLLRLVEAAGERTRLEARAARIAGVLEGRRPLPARAACF